MGRPPFPTLVAALTAVCLLVSTGVRLRGDTPLVQVDSAFVTADETGRGWTVGNDLIRYSIGQEGPAIVVRGIQDVVTGVDWRRADDPDSFVTINGTRIEVGSFITAFQKAEASEWFGGARLDVTYRLASPAVEITRSYAAYPGSSVIETWTTFHAAGTASVTLSGMTNFALTVPNGTLNWLRGLNNPDDQGGPFTLSSGDLDDQQTFELGATQRASEESLPWFSLASTDDTFQATQFFGSILWSGQWRFRIRRHGDQVSLQMGLPDFKTTLAAGASLESPHAIFGTTNRVVPEVAMATRSFIEKGIRHGRPFNALATYNTWFSYGTFIDQDSMRAEMDLAAGMGMEQFVVDAGWWFDIDPDDPSNFARHWGTWQVDEARFPDGIGGLTDYAHGLGMKFGIWVEPERVDLSTVPTFNKERFLATVDGRYEPGTPNSQATSAQICFADPEARDWLMSKLTAFLDDAHPDYLKWDNNFWVNCNRPNHGHGAEDGNFQHMRGLETALTELRDRYPDMDIENSAGGGHRLSLQMLAVTDVGWVDDRSSPSPHVRHNLEGLSVLFPPAYLFTFAMGDQNETFDGSSDLRLVMRSRMAGMLGGTWTAASMGEDTSQGIRDQVALYKRIRPIVQEGSTILLGQQIAQFPDQTWSGWDAVEHILPRTGDAVILAFDTAEGPDSVIVKPKALRSDADYDVESADFGPLGTVGGAELMSRGIELSASGVTHSHVLIFTMRGSASPFRRK